jgi:hypothetical protein
LQLVQGTRQARMQHQMTVCTLTKPSAPPSTLQIGDSTAQPVVIVARVAYR